jgi:hypothetical protein
MQTPKLILAAGAFCVILSGCASSTDPTPSTTVKPPAANSQFYFTGGGVDSTGALIASSVFSDTVVVVSTGQTFAGRSNVLVTKLTNSAPLYYDNYESNGDVALYVDEGSGPGKHPGWLVLPNASKTTQSLTYFDTTEGSAHITKTQTATYQGTENVTLNGKTWTAAKVLVTTTFSAGNSPAPQTYWVVPELSGVIKIVTPFSHDASGASHNGFQLTMTGYQLK